MALLLANRYCRIKVGRPQTSIPAGQAGNRCGRCLDEGAPRNGFSAMGLAGHEASLLGQAGAVLVPQIIEYDLVGNYPSHSFY